MRIVLFLLLLFPLAATSQKIYSPKGKEIKVPADIKTPDDIFTYLHPGPKPYVYHVQGYGDDTGAIVVFQLLTNWAVFVECTHPERVQEYIDQFNLEGYFASPEFEKDMRKHIQYRDLTAVYVTDKLGEPDAQTRDEDGDIITESYDYAKFNCTLIITNGYVTRFMTVKTNDR